MDIRIGRKWRLTSDAFNIILEKCRIAGTKAENPGEKVWKQMGFYATIDAAVAGLVDKKIKSSDATTLKELADYVKELKKEIKAAVKM